MITKWLLFNLETWNQQTLKEMLYVATLVCQAVAHLLRVTSSLPINQENEAYTLTEIPRHKREFPMWDLSFSNIKTSIPKVIHTFSEIRPHKKYRVCICNEPPKNNCGHQVPRVELTRQNDVKKTKKGHYKTYLDSIAEKDRKFCRTSTTDKSTTRTGEKCTRTTLSSTRTTPSVCDYSSTVFIGVIACPENNAKISYFLWVRPNRRNISVKAKCQKRKQLVSKHVVVLGKE